MRCLVPFAVLLTAVAAAQPAPPTRTEIRALVKQLGSDEYAEREAAGKKLDAIGAPALDELRIASRSDNPEVVHRASTIRRGIERRLDNEKTLAPTLVELDVKDRRLDDVLADLSKQAKCDVVLGGLKQGELADRKVTLSTGGSVPFWTALLQVCDSADMQVAAVGAFLAPDGMPYLGRAPRGVRVAANTEKAIVLEARGAAKRRPAAVFGAVLVEAVPFPKGAAGTGSAALLQVWPEPRLAWQATKGFKVAHAIDAAGVKLAADTTPPAPAPRNEIGPNGVILVRNADGTARLIRNGVSDDVAGAFRPNARQALMQFRGEARSPGVAKELGVSLFGTVRSPIAPLARATKLEVNRVATATSIAGVEMTVHYSKNSDGRLVATVGLNYERTAVQHAGVDMDLPGAKGGGPGIGNHTVHGVHITDADGKPYSLGLIGGSGRSGRGNREVMSLTLELHPDKNGAGPPAIATFWGTYAKPVEVPVLLKDVPLGGQ